MYLFIKPNVRNDEILDREEINRSNESLRSELEQINTSLCLAKYKVYQKISDFIN